MPQENHNIVSWADAWRIYSRPTVLGMVFFGFSAGLPYLLVFSTLTAWLTEEGVSRSAIGLFCLGGYDLFGQSDLGAYSGSRSNSSFGWLTRTETELDFFWSDSGGRRVDRYFHSGSK